MTWKKFQSKNCSKLKKILVIRFSSIGDIVLSTPVIRGLKLQLDAEVHFLTKASFQAVLAENPYIDQVITIKKEVTEVLPHLKEAKYDYVIDLHKNLRSLQVKRALSSKNLAFDKINLQKWLLVNFKINRLPEVHIVDRYLETVAALGVKNDGQGLDYFIAAKDEVAMDTLLPSGVDEFIGFVIGAAHATKRLPEDKIIEICQMLRAPIILLGGPGEQEIGASIAAASGPHVINACGLFRLNQSASIVRQAKLIISHDTGLMHIAAAYQKRILSVWGNTIPAFGMYPYYGTFPSQNNSIEVAGLSCRPCSKIGYQKCPKGHFKCMRAIDVEEIRRLVNSYEKGKSS